MNSYNNKNHNNNIYNNYNKSGFDLIVISLVICKFADLAFDVLLQLSIFLLNFWYNFGSNEELPGIVVWIYLWPVYLVLICWSSFDLLSNKCLICKYIGLFSDLNFVDLAFDLML